MNSNDIELLRRYVFERSEAAFADLVRQHIALVHSAALRQTHGDAPLAQDVTQAVFTDLARKAARLTRHTSLAGWLYTSTRYTAAALRRAEQRRSAREQEAHAMNQLLQSAKTDPVWEQLRPVLDEAMHDLKADDREAVLLRYFEHLPLAAVGARLGVTENTARMRVDRALDKLRGALVRRGVTSTAGALAVILTGQAAGAVPAGLAAAVSSNAVTTAGTASALSVLLARFLISTKFKLLAGAAAVVTLVLVKALLPGSAPAQPPAANAQTAEAKPTLGPSNAGQHAAGNRSAKAASERVFWLNIRTAADNQPIPGTGVILNCWGRGGVVHEATFQSDTNGLCELTVPAVDFNIFRIWVSAAEFIPKVMDWKPYELEDPMTSYTMKLDRGLKIEGLTCDEQGRPIPGAKVSFLGPGVNQVQRENVALYSRLSVVQSDHSGRFVSHQMPWNAEFHIGLVVTHPDYAAQWLPILLPEGLQTNWIVVLTRGVALPGRVLSTNGEAIAGASVLVRESHGGPDVSATTDDQGTFTLAHQPQGPARLEVSAVGFLWLAKNVLVESNTMPVLLELEPAPAIPSPQVQRTPIRFHGTVVDADSGVAIPRFKVLLDERRGISRDLLGEGRNGAFDWENSLTFASEYTLEVDADGYEPQVSSVRQRADGDQTFEFRLRQGGLLAGQVLQPDGRPAAGAALGLDGDGDGFNLRFQPPAKFANYGHAVNQTTSGSQGAFSLKSMAGATSILLVHESGCAAVPTTLPGTNLVIQLEAWGSIDGTVYVGSTAAADQTVDVGFESAAYAADGPRLKFDLMTKSDNNGQFRFERVPPGNHTVYRRISPRGDQPGPIGFSQGQPVTVRPGESAQVTLGGKGRPVIGQFVLSHPLTNYNWRGRLVALVQDKPELVPPRMSQFPSSLAFFRAWGVYDASIAKYYLNFESDGAFRVDDVLPGQYRLAFSVTTPPADPLSEFARTDPGQELGGITNTVVVPPMTSQRTDEPLDLGAILVPVKEAPSLSHANAKH